MIEYKHITGNTGYIILDQTLVVIYDIDDKRSVIIDSGYKEHPELITWSEERGRKIVAVLVTHNHVDHIGNNGLIQKKMKADIYAARREYQWQQESFRSDRDITFEWMGRERYFFGDSGMYETIPIEPDQTEIEICGAVFNVEDLSGHSPAHLGFATPDGVLHIGDAFMSDRVLRHSKIPYEYNVGKTLDSLERMKKMDYPYFAAAHRAVISAGDVCVVLDANISYHKRMLNEILQRLNGWQRTDRFIHEVIANRGVDIRRSSSSGWLPDAIRSYIDYLINEGKVETRRGLLTGTGEPAFPGELYIKKRAL